jgi:hypothetical protein
MEKNIKKTFSELFSKYIQENKDALSTIGIVATVTALFLNVNPIDYAGIKGILVLLLMGLIFLFCALAYTTLLWFMRNHDSFIGGLFFFSITLFTWRLTMFIVENFRNELNDYLGLISISVSIIVISYLLKIQNYFESKFPKNIFRFLFFGLSTFFYLYAGYIILAIYGDFSNSRYLEVSILLEPFNHLYLLLIPLWIVLVSFSRETFKRGLKNWFTIIIFWIPIFVFLTYLILESTY